MGNLPGGWELILILLVVVLVFGAKRLPDSARALGRSMRILKAETKGMRDDEAADASGVTPATTTTAQVEASPTPHATTPPVTPSQPVQAPAPGQSRQP